jgi:uncharacterized membrane-anchored protein YjiN (DUF445 family)
MRLVAVTLLLAAAVVYLATLRAPAYGLWGYVNAGAGAAMVGALADWFAVTAIFRHPLGVPIPHTALVPKRKAELGRSLQDFVAQHFLTEEVVRGRLLAAEVPLRLGVWLGDAEHRTRAMTEIVRVARAAVGRVREDEVRAFVEDVLLPRLVREPVSPIAGDLLDAVVADHAHQGLVDLVAGEVHEWLSDNPKVFAALISDRAPWWTPAWVDEKVITWTYQQALAWLQDIRLDPQHPTRQALDALLLRLAHDLQHDEEVMARAESLKARLLQHPQVGDTAVSLWRSLRTSLLAAMDDPTSALYGRLDRWLGELGSRLVSDASLRSRLDSDLGDAVSFMVTTYGDELATVISHTIDQWDGDAASERIELLVGRDLQFIRVNGTVVGALAGLAIHAIGALVR